MSFSICIFGQGVLQSFFLLCCRLGCMETGVFPPGLTIPVGCFGYRNEEKSPPDQLQVQL